MSISPPVWEITNKPTLQSFHFDCKGFHAVKHDPKSNVEFEIDPMIYVTWLPISRVFTCFMAHRIHIQIPLWQSDIMHMATCCMKTPERWRAFPRHALFVGILAQMSSNDVRMSRCYVTWRHDVTPWHHMPSYVIPKRLFASGWTQVTPS